MTFTAYSVHKHVYVTGLDGVILHILIFQKSTYDKLILSYILFVPRSIHDSIVSRVDSVPMNVG